MKNIFVSINHSVSQNLNNFVKDNNLQKEVGIFADLPIFFVPLFLVSMWIYYVVKDNNIEKKRGLIYIFFSMFISVIFNLFIQHIVHIQRPETFIHPILDHIPDASFPSDHAAVSFAFLTSIYLFGYKRLFWIFLPFVLLMDMSRIAGGVHWFWDIIVGMLVGGFSAFIVWKVRKNSFLTKITDFILKIASFIKL